MTRAHTWILARQVANGSQPLLVATVGSKCRSMREIMRVAKRVDLAAENDECGSGEREDELLLCNKCDNTSFDTKKRRRDTRTLEFSKKQRRLLTHIPSQDPVRRLAQMSLLAMAMTSHNLEYNNDTYNPSMAHRSANRSSFENGRIQVLCKEDVEILKNCRALYIRREFPPLVVAFEGYTVEADVPIRDMILIVEYADNVDYIRNREEDDCDSMMTLLSSADPSKILVACADRLGNISRFISGINNHTTYNVDKECVALLVANRDIANGERQYYDYNGCEYEYPTH
ncbi:hypothetical protein MIMGU_mgv1a022865mg, partial [Erythranthe guttata]